MNELLTHKVTKKELKVLHNFRVELNYSNMYTQIFKKEVV